MDEVGIRPPRASLDVEARDLLILAIAERQDRMAFIKLFEYFAPRLKAYIIRIGGADLAEEMAQEAMLALWRKSRLFDPTKASASTWVFTIARNLFIDRRRKEQRPEFDLSDPFRIGLEEPTADQEYSSRETERAIATALRDLPPEQAKVIAMAFYEDKSHSAIATELKLPLGTVKSRLRLAFARLRGRLDVMK